MISTPVVAGLTGSSAQRAKSSMVLSTPRDDSLRGRNGLIGALIDDGSPKTGDYA